MIFLLEQLNNIFIKIEPHNPDCYPLSIKDVNRNHFWIHYASPEGNLTFAKYTLSNVNLINAKLVPENLYLNLLLITKNYNIPIIPEILKYLL